MEIKTYLFAVGFMLIGPVATFLIAAFALTLTMELSTLNLIAYSLAIMGVIEVVQNIYMTCRKLSSLNDILKALSKENKNVH